SDGRKPDHRTPCRRKPEPYRCNEIDDGEKNRRRLPGDRLIFKGYGFSESNPADACPVIEALEHRDGGHCPQKKNKPPRPTSDRAVTLVLMNRLKRSNIFVSCGPVHGNTSSALPSGAKWRSTSASPTSASAAGCQRGSLSLSTITARTPS